MESAKGEGEEEESVEIEIPLGDGAAEAFDLEKTVCSHGLFMMAPNSWDPLSHTFSRPLRLDNQYDDDAGGDPGSVFVSISRASPGSLQARVQGTSSLSERVRHSLVGQVVRMLRLSDEDERVAREFRKMAGGGDEEEEEEGFSEALRAFGGRVFRSPTLFEDMVKCILLCNCQWSRTLSMAASLCELQLELSCKPSGVSDVQATNGSSKSWSVKNSFIPNTPAARESRRNPRELSKASKNLTRMLPETEADVELDTGLGMDSTQMRRVNLSPAFSPNGVEAYSSETCNSRNELDRLFNDHCLQLHQSIQLGTDKRVGNFPSPRELANLDERFLAKRCNLGYRASRIIKLAKGIVEGSIPLREFEQVCNGTSLSIYSEVADQLREIDGFGPFTCANVLMCMGFYHVIPTDSETVRHLKQVHAKNSTIRTVQRDVEEIYSKHAPFQFLAYWAEMWYFYEQRFGKLSEMQCSDYRLITASNMRKKGSSRNKRAKSS